MNSTICHCVLWRHAEAEDFNRAGDLARQLTERGQQQAEQTARWIADIAQRRDYALRLITSPAVRTTQTAQHLSTLAGIQALTETSIAPGAAPKAVLRVLKTQQQHAAPTTLFVLTGHQPTLGQTLAHMLFEPGFDADDYSLSVKKSAAWWLSGHLDHGQWTVRGVFCPE